MPKKEKKEFLEGQELTNYLKKIKKFIIIMATIGGITMMFSWFCPWRF